MLALAIAVLEFGSRAAPLPSSAEKPTRRAPRFGGHSGGDTPGSIPNPEVKPSSADGTALETGWESRSPPGHLRNEAASRGGFLRFGSELTRGARTRSEAGRGALHRYASGMPRAFKPRP